MSSRHEEDYIQKYAKDLVFQKAAPDYERQIEKWEREFTKVGAAFKKAFDNHIGALQDADKSRQADMELCFMAFTLISSWTPAAPFVSPALTLLSRDIEKRNNKRLDERIRKVLNRRTRTYDQPISKIVGTMPTSFVGAGFKNLPRLTLRSSPVASLELKSSGDHKTSPDDFGRMLKNALYENKKVVWEGIQDLGEEIGNSVDFGKSIMNIRSVRRIKDYDRRKARARLFVEVTLDNIINGWMGEWYYYGNNPNFPSEDMLKRAMEREMWALWVLDKKIGFVPAHQEYPLHRLSGGWHAGPTMRQISSHVKNTPHSLVLDRFAELDVINARSVTTMLPQIRRMKAMGQEPLKIWGKIDEKTEVDLINKWARDTMPNLISGNLQAVKRTPLDITNVFGGYGE